MVCVGDKGEGDCESINQVEMKYNERNNTWLSGIGASVVVITCRHDPSQSSLPHSQFIIIFKI